MSPAGGVGINLAIQDAVATANDLYPKHLTDDTTEQVPLIFTAFRVLPPLRYAMGRFIGLGVRQEHIKN